MVANGFQRVTPTHIRALTKRYQRVLGELRYTRQQGAAEAQEALARTADSLCQALRICAPDTDLAVLQPIRFRPPEPLDDLALTRAVLGSLRAHPDGLVPDVVATDVAVRHGLVADPSLQTRLATRVRRKLTRLSKRGLVTQTAGRWRLA